MVTPTMPAILTSSRSPGSALEVYTAFSRRQPVMVATGVVLLLSMAPLGFAALVDERLLDGISVWSKPLKFAFALSIYSLTLAFFSGWIVAARREVRWFRIVMLVAAAAILFEQAYISLQATNGQHSHFNGSSPVYAVLYAAMGIGAVVLTGASLAVAVAIWRYPATTIGAPLREAAVTGLLLTFFLTIITAGTMNAMGGHWVGGIPSDAGGLALMGWARDGGDLRVPHFFSTHAMHALPIAGLASIFVFGPERRAPARTFAGLYVAFVLAVFAQALTGRPFI